MKRKLYLIALLPLLSIACSKNPIEEKLPATNADYSRSFFFPRTGTTENVVTNESTTITLLSYYNSLNALAVGLEVNLPSGTDQLNLTIKKDKLKTGIVGDYIISPFLTAGKPEGDVDVSYGYSRTPPQTLFILPGAAEGILHITDYNEKYKLLKGNFTLRINSDKDPRVATTTVWENTQIDVTGSFENLQIKPQ